MPKYRLTATNGAGTPYKVEVHERTPGEALVLALYRLQEDHGVNIGDVRYNSLLFEEIIAPPQPEETKRII